MAYIALICPKCGASLELEDNREFGFCQYCGTRIMIEQQKITNNSTTNNTTNNTNSTTVINNYYGGPVNSQPTNAGPRSVEVEISRGKCLNDSCYSFKIALDGKEVANLKRGKSQKIAMVEGVHNIEVSTPGVSGTITFRSTVKIEGDTRIETGFEGKLIRKIYVHTSQL